MSHSCMVMDYLEFNNLEPPELLPYSLFSNYYQFKKKKTVESECTALTHTDLLFLL